MPKIKPHKGTAKVFTKRKNDIKLVQKVQLSIEVVERDQA